MSDRIEPPVSQTVEADTRAGSPAGPGNGGDPIARAFYSNFADDEIFAASDAVIVACLTEHRVNTEMRRLMTRALTAHRDEPAIARANQATSTARTAANLRRDAVARLAKLLEDR